ncbi:MAG: hypothetical protein QF506_01805 [Candidatus Woesearchaeota archaeon]|jgi:hypothetical protein|nr:hypothetical protein [Candidatus Woesearchaeota archaeon]|tara:strand:+ start:4063 stop:4560 length:498 start_codon:yes stop_codon:yes gene_type:complete
MADLGLKEIIGIVLALSFLVLGVSIIRTTMLKGEDIVNLEIDVRARENVERILSTRLDDDTFVVSQSSFKLKRGKDSSFLIGIKNDDSAESELSITIVESGGDVQAKDIFVYKEEPMILKPASKEFLIGKIIIPDDMPDGDYIFDVNLMREDERMKSRQIVVKVG